MAYCTVEDMTAHAEPNDIAGMCSENADATILDKDVLAVCDKVIAAAGALLDSYLIGRFGSQLRTMTTPDLIKYKCAWLAVYKLKVRRGTVDDDWEKDYDNTIEWLIDLRDGKGEITEVTSTGAAIDEPEDSIQHDAEDGEDGDDDIADADQRRYLPSKQKKLWGV